MSEIVYRQASSQDFIALAKIRALGSGSIEHWADRIENYWRGLVNPQHALAPRIIYVAVFDNEVVGFIAGHLTQRLHCEGELQWIDTIPAFRNRGIASHLLKLLAAWFVNNNAYKICVDPGNAVARRFYQRNGAANLDDHWMFWSDIKMIV